MDDLPKKLIKPAVLAGFRDILPTVAIHKEDMVDCIKAVFRSYGFCPIETPHLEYTEMLIGNSGSEIKKQLYRFRDNGDRDVTLRFDHTVPLARFISQHKNTLGLPFKRYAVGNVFRGESPQAGRYREFTQCDFDYIGTRSVAADAEIVQVIVHSLEALKLDDFTVKINHRKILNGLAHVFGLEHQTAALLRIIDKLDKIPAQKVQELLQNEFKLSAEDSEKMIRFVTPGHSADEAHQQTATLAELKSLNHPLILEGLDELQQLTTILKKSGIGENQCCIDLSIARGLDYYTGIVYETKLNRLPKIGSVASGGRYDNLTGGFSKDVMPGVGASIGLDRLIAAMEQLGLLQYRNTTAQVLIGNLDENYMADSFSLAGKLRQAGIYTEVYPSAEKISKLFNYASRKGFYVMIAFGENEVKEEKYVIADLRTGDKMSVSGSSQLISKLQDMLR